VQNSEPGHGHHLVPLLHVLEEILTAMTHAPIGLVYEAGVGSQRIGADDAPVG
jgi:hypothetical protein